MRPLFKWYARHVVFNKPDDPPAGGGGGLPAPVPTDPPKNDPPKGPDPKPAPETPVDTMARDIARLKKHTRLDEPPGSPAAKKQEDDAGLPLFSIFD
jgi:hypothetical protein